MDLKVKTTASGGRNIAVEISGFIRPEDQLSVLYEFDSLKLKLTSVLFLIQEKAGVLLWWDEDKTSLILPLESRGAFKFDGRKPPEEWTGKIYIEPFKVDEPKAILIVLEFDK